MNKLQTNIKAIIQEAEKLNASKTAAIGKLQGRLNICPGQYLLPTKRFINAINNNIRDRQKLIDELNVISILTKSERLIEITYKLQEIDNKDLMASNMYSVAMDEMGIKGEC